MAKRPQAKSNSKTGASTDQAADARSKTAANTKTSADTAGSREGSASSHEEAMPARSEKPKSAILPAFLAGALGGAIVAGLIFWLGAMNGLAGSDSDGTAQAEIERLSAEVAALADAKPAISLDEVNALLDGQAATLQAEIAELKTNLSKAGETASRGQQQSAKVDSVLNDLGAELAELTAKQAGAEEALDGLVSNLKSVERDQSRSPITNRRLALFALKSSINSGEPYGNALALAENLFEGNSALTDLKAKAASGVATVAELRKTFTAISGELIDEANIPPDGDLLDQITGIAKSVVRVRPVGMVAGDDPAARIARMESHLEDGNLKDSLMEFEALPPHVTALAADWAAEAQQTQAALSAVERLNQDVPSEQAQ